MVKTRANPIILIAFTLSGILLLITQFGVISPFGIIEISQIQYIWLFWFSIIFFIVSTALLIVRVPRHARWSQGYSGIITRTVRIGDNQKDYFIQGEVDTPLREVLLANWPFDGQDPDSKWHVVDNRGNDITDAPLDSLDGTAIIIVEEDA